MFNYRATLTGIMLLLSTAQYANAELSPAEIEAKTKGLIFWNQLKGAPAKLNLEIAAKAGDRDSQYYLAEYLRTTNFHMTAEAQRLYEAAAAQGDVDAMLRLGDRDKDICELVGKCSASRLTPAQWHEKAKELATGRANQGDGEAMFQLFNLTRSKKWLVKAAEAGYPPAQFRLVYYSEEHQGFLTSKATQNAFAEKWLKAAAEGGYTKAMVEYGYLLKKRGDMQGLAHWIELATKAGDYDAMLNYAVWYAHQPDEVGYSLDLVKSYGLMKVMVDAQMFYKENLLDDVVVLMTPEQVEAGKAFAVEWQATYAPVSRFPDRYNVHY